MVENPYLFGADRYLYDHDVGVDADAQAMDSTLESGDIEIGEGEQIMLVRKLVPDFKVLTGAISISLKGRKYPNGVQKTRGPFTVTSSTTYINPRMRTRQLAIALESNAIGANWRGGIMRGEIVPSGKR